MNNLCYELAPVAQYDRPRAVEALAYSEDDMNLGMGFHFVHMLAIDCLMLHTLAQFPGDVK